MWEKILSEIQNTLDGITEVKSTFNYPLSGNPTTFPSVIYFPTSMVENAFDSTAENFKIFTVNLSLLVTLSGTKLETVFSNILPKIADRVVAEFDKEWDMGSIDGHRMWARVSTGDVDYQVDKAGGVASMNMVLEVKVNTNN